MQAKWTLEDDVNDYVKNRLESLGLKKLKDYNVESSMSDYMKEALRGSAKQRIRQTLVNLTFTLKNTIFLLYLRIN